jgi:hypothetical protein
MMDGRLESEMQKKDTKTPGDLGLYTVCSASYGPMNKLDGRFNRLLIHASSAIQNGIQKKRSEG